jgi:hypothetical protein
VVVTAILLGRGLNRRLKDHGFLRLVYVGLIAIGSLLVVEAVRT